MFLTQIIKLSNGWYRYSVSYYANFGVSVAPAITISPSSAVTFPGDGNYSGFIYGAQLEVGRHLTSYIPTSASLVTRGVDNIQANNVAGLLDMSVGTFYIEAAAFTQADIDSRIFILRTYKNSFVSIQFQQNGKLRFNIRTPWATYRWSQYGYNVTDFNKIAISWSSLGIFAYVNGAQVWSVPTPTYLPVATNGILYFHRGGRNHSWAHSKIKKVIVFKNQLTTAECTALTR